MAKCEQCGATIVLGSKSLAGYKFCSQKCIEDGKKSGLQETQEDIDAQISSPLVPLLAGIHALLPLLLLYISQTFLGSGSTVLAYIGVILFWSWFIWLWPLLGSQGSKNLSFKVSLAISIAGLLVAAIPVLLLTLVGLNIKFHI